MTRFSLFFLFVFLNGISFSQVNLNNGLVAYYPFNGDASDASGNGNNAVFNNATLTTDRLGYPNSAYSFNGIDNYIRVPNSVTLNTGSQISLCAYVKVNGFYTGPCHGNDIINKGQHRGNTNFYFLRFDDGEYTNGANCTNSVVDMIHQNFYGNATFSSPGYSPHIVTNEWYCLVYTYDGTIARLYVDGIARVQNSNAPGYIMSNNEDLYLGRLFDPADPTNFPYWFNGTMDEVRIYNRALTQEEVDALCLPPVNASFTATDTVCINSPVTIQNTSQGATNYFWSFCTANINQPPTGTNLGNPGGALSAPVYMDYVFTNGNYYGFVTNNNPGGLVRLDFGNSLLNTPSVTSLGNIGGAIPGNTEGVQIANDGGNWYVLIVGGDAGSGSIPSLTTVSLGTNIANNAPTATNWGNIGNLSYPHDLYVFNDNGRWHGLTVNYSNSTVTLFDLTTSLANPPSAVNLGNIGNLSGPTGIQAVNDNGNWHVFVTNATTSTLTRLDFGASLLNIPTGVNLGNPNNAFVTCWDIYMLKYCGQNDAFVINANGTNDIVKLGFGGSLLNTPTAASLGNQGNLSFPHCISKLFRVGADVFGFITNVNNNTLSLLRFQGCTNASIPNSTAQNPPSPSYNGPGIYNINLTVDDGLPTQSSYCKQVVVQNCDTIINDYTEVLNFDICKNELIVADATKYDPGDTVLIIQMKGAVIDSTNSGTFGTISDYKNAGNYEMNIIKQKNGNTLSLLNVLQRQYDVPFGKVQLVRVPYYKRIVVSKTITCLPWDGGKGGIVVLDVQDTAYMDANIDVSGKGFRGGRSPNPNTTTLYCDYNDFYYPAGTGGAAEKGESIASTSDAIAWGKGAPANGGGGGNGHNSGGGGGSNGGAGGFGGYQLDACGGSATDNRGLGGRGLTYSNADNKIFMGGGGGSGHTDNAGGSPMNGGSGGGIAIVRSRVLVTRADIVAKGGDAPQCNLSPINLCHDGSGGGGGAGTVLLENQSIVPSVHVDTRGGKGGDLAVYFTPDATKIGPGGGGGAGVCWVSNNPFTFNIIVNEPGGINGVIIPNGNDPYGATAGQSGIDLSNLKIPVDTILFNKNIDSVRIQDSFYNCTTYNFKAIGYTERSPVSSWAWDFGDGATASSQVTSHNYITAGTYTVKLVVTDINGCKDSISRPFTTSTLNIIKSNDTSTCGSSPVQLSAGGGVTYSWSPAASLDNPSISTPVATPLATTVYRVAVTNADGCTKTDSIKITVNSLPIISKSNDTAVCSISAVQLFAGGGVSYSWTPATTLDNPGIFNPVAKPASTTTYAVTVTNAAGCSNEDSVTITVKGLPVVTKSNDTAVCLNSLVQLFAGGGASYSWTPSATLDNPGIGNPVATPAATTIYHVTVTNAVGCTKEDSIKITVNSLPVISKSNDTAICNNSSVTLFAGGGTAFSWTPVSTLSNPGIFNPIASPAGNTTYYVTVTNAAGCSQTDSIKITTSAPPIITKSNDTSVCFNTPLQLFAAGGSVYSWTPASTLDNAGIFNPVATPAATATYVVKVTNAAGCSGKDSVTITVKGLPVVTKSNDTAICINSGVQLLAGGGVTYSWTPSATLDNPGISNPVASPATTTFYHVTVTNAVGCTKEDSIKITVNSLPVISKSNDTAICSNSSVTLFAGGGTAFSWTPVSTLSNPGIFNPVASPAGNTTYYITVTNAAGCSQTDSIKLTTIAPPIITKSNDTSVCINTPAQLFAAGGSVYSWTPVASLDNAGISNPVATPATPTTYYVVVTNPGGCSKVDSVKIGINPSAVITKSNDTSICNQASVKLFVSGGSSYLWAPSTSLDDPSSASPVASPQVTTLYTVTVTDIRSCSYKDSVKVSIRDAPVFAVSPDKNVCSGVPQQLQASGGDTYLWVPAEGLSDPRISSPLANPQSSTTYTVTIHSNACDETDVLSTTVSLSPPLGISASSSNDITCSMASSQLNATGGTNYTWIPATGLNDSNISNPVASPVNTTLYKVTGTDINGCSGSDTVTVKVNFNINTLYGLPNSFTPNNDGINDCFGIKSWGVVRDLDFNIYNRFGEKVFHTNDAGICWDGTYKQKPQNANVFVYTIKGKTACGNIDRKGIVVLLK